MTYQAFYFIDIIRFIRYNNVMVNITRLIETFRILRTAQTDVVCADEFYSLKRSINMEKIDYAKISSDNVRFLMNKSNISVRKLAESVGVAPTTLNDSLKSKKGIPIDTLIRIARYFETTVNDLCNREFTIKTLSESSIDNNVINKIKKLDHHGKRVVNTVLDIEYERIISDKKQKIKAHK